MKFNKLLSILICVFFTSQSLFSQNIYASDLSGEYEIMVKSTERFLHENGGGDKLVSTRWQPLDGHTRFILELQSDNSYKVKVKSNNRHWHVDSGNDKVLSTRWQPNDTHTRFFFELQKDGSYRIKLKASGRYLNEDSEGDKLISTRNVVNNADSRFYLFPMKPENAITKKAIGENVKRDVTDAVTAEFNSQGLVGLAVGVVIDGRITHFEYRGFEDNANRIPMSHRTMMRWASCAKPVMATACLRLYQDDHLNLNADVRNYVTNYQNTQNRAISTLQLLQHTSGIGHYPQMNRDNSNWTTLRDNYPSDKAFNAAEALKIFNNTRLYPLNQNTGDLYSTFGYNLVSILIDTIAQETYEKGVVEYIDDMIATPLGMHRFQPDYEFKTIPNRAVGYSGNAASFRPITNSRDVTWKLGGGGYISTIVDMARFTKGLMNCRVLCPESVEQLWTGSEISHNGSQQKTKTYFIVNPVKQVSVVVMSNSEWCDPTKIGNRIMNIVRDAEKRDGGRSGDYFAGAWKSGTTDQKIVKGMLRSDFFKKWKKLNDEGYQLTDIETFEEVGVRKWDGVYTKGSGKSALWRNYDESGFRKKWKEESANGYRLIDLETYTDNGKRKWAGVFQQGKGSYALILDLNHNDFNSKRQALSFQGLTLVDIETYMDNGVQKWAGVFIQGKPSAMWRNLDRKEFHAKRKEMSKRGMKLIDIEVYKVDGKRRWAGIFIKSDSKSFLFRYGGCLDTFKKIEKQKEKGLELVDLEQF